jgi:hypothetical protein
VGQARDGFPMTTGRTPPRPGWLAAIRRYLLAVTIGNLIWEMAQLPLYTLWRTEPVRSLWRAILHCTAADLVIATVMLVIVLAIVGEARWPNERPIVVAAAVIAGGVAYTIGSEHLNTVVLRTWTYTEWMPTVPWIGTGLAPLAQWLAVPAVAFVFVRRGARQ